MVQLLLLESWLGCLGDLDLGRCYTARLCSSLLGKLSLLCLDSLFFTKNILSSRRIGVCPDDFIWTTLELNLLYSHFGAVLKVKPEFSVSNRFVLDKTFGRGSIFINLFSELFALNLLLNVIITLVTGS